MHKLYMLPIAANGLKPKNFYNEKKPQCQFKYLGYSFCWNKSYLNVCSVKCVSDFCILP